MRQKYPVIKIVLFLFASTTASTAEDIKYAARFTMTAPDAKLVEVAGDFSQWEPLPMVRDEHGGWNRTFYLAPGAYQYKLKVGESWMIDSTNPKTADDGKGVVNSLIEVEPPAPTTRPMKMGAMTLTPGSFIRFDIPHSGKSWVDAKKYAKARNYELDQNSAKTNKVEVGLLLPENFDPAKTWPILVVNAPGDFSSVGHLECCFLIAADAGYVAVAADGPVSRFFSASSALDYLYSQWPGSEKWPVACGGFSGGAKLSGEIAAMLADSGRRIIGIWMGGCNEDYASAGLNLYKPNPGLFKRVPIFIASGLTDDIATPSHANGVRESLEKTGFKNVRLESYDGGHHPVPPHMVKQGLLWFIAAAKEGQQTVNRSIPLTLPPPSIK